MNDWFTDDRGVSETVGFVLVFALVAMVITVTFTGGISALESAQEAERDANVERAFDVLYDNTAELHHDGVPSRATEIKLAGGSLAYSDHTEIRLENEDETVAEIRSRPIVYAGHGDTTIVYEAGAVLRSDGGSSVMLNEPGFVFDETISVGLIDLSTAGRETVSGDVVVLLTAEQTSRTHEATIDEPEGLALVIESDRADAWKRYFETAASDVVDEGGVDRNGRTVTVEINENAVDRIDIVRTGIEVRFR